MGLRDERGYQYHAGLHGLPLPIQCRHGDILFLPWHRAYLYFFELAWQDRVPEVAIPWWDWTSASAHQDGLPPTHAPQAREDGRPNPLFDSENAPAAGRTRLPAVAKRRSAHLRVVRIPASIFRSHLSENQNRNRH
jgi:tyrosinase